LLEYQLGLEKRIQSNLLFRSRILRVSIFILFPLFLNLLLQHLFKIQNSVKSRLPLPQSCSANVIEASTNLGENGFLFLHDQPKKIQLIAVKYQTFFKTCTNQKKQTFFTTTGAAAGSVAPGSAPEAASGDTSADAASAEASADAVEEEVVDVAFFAVDVESFD